MVGIIVTFFVTLVGLILLFIFSFGVDENSSQSTAAPNAFGPLPGVSAAFAPDLQRALRKEDYQQLLARPELDCVRRRFWRDRRRILVMSLGELERDVRVLWQFRRFLVSNGLHVTLQDEIGVACAALVVLFYLKALCVAAYLLGPFALSRAAQKARSLVQLLSRRDVALLARVPSPRRAEIERKWAQHLLLRTG